MLDEKNWITTTCYYCRGDGYTAEHSSDPHENGECNGCPVQEQCSYCHAEGKVMTLDEVRKLIKLLEDSNEISRGIAESKLH